MRRYLLIGALCLATAGCVDRDAQARTGADLWHMGHALERGQLNRTDQHIMGGVLKEIGTKMVEENGYDGVDPSGATEALTHE